MCGGLGVENGGGGGGKCEGAKLIGDGTQE